MKLERINTAKGFCAKRSQRIPELHRNSVCALACVFYNRMLNSHFSQKQGY